MTESANPDAACGVLNINEIMKFLPHRYPFLMVDRVVSMTYRQKVSAYKNVSINEPFFQGHFPGLPLMPGVLIVEALAQAGAFLILHGLPADTVRNSVFLFAGIEGVRFRKPVVPGDRLDLECELLKQKMRLWKMRGTASVDGVPAAEAVLTAAVVPRGEPA
ncbi:MAG: 3-hydroxyacyl-ACP dehydratase FabZ [Desulfovibrio sp.]|jgi:3-hydroxyacyl-[acyl-carrier-protein] dehydratase|nr:3-hydroxyacyl-ACP dehydratase FabZ [Desulfovibrio sp.]